MPSLNNKPNKDGSWQIHHMGQEIEVDTKPMKTKLSHSNLELAYSNHIYRCCVNLAEWQRDNQASFIRKPLNDGVSFTYWIDTSNGQIILKKNDASYGIERSNS